MYKSKVYLQQQKDACATIFIEIHITKLKMMETAMNGSDIFNELYLSNMN